MALRWIWKNANVQTVAMKSMEVFYAISVPYDHVIVQMEGALIPVYAVAKNASFHLEVIVVTNVNWKHLTAVIRGKYASRDVNATNARNHGKVIDAMFVGCEIKIVNMVVLSILRMDNANVSAQSDGKVLNAKLVHWKVQHVVQELFWTKTLVFAKAMRLA